MSITAILSAILMLTAGIGIFLVACQMMSTNLESASSQKLRSLFSKVSHNKWLGVGIGTVTTAAIQSSGATTVMVIGFVNAGIISLTQAATMIYGANIGTTITAQIVALGMFGANTLSTSVIFSAFAGIGAFMMLFAKKEMLKKLGGIITGFGMLFVGLTLMSDSMSEFAALDSVKLFLAKINNPLLLVLIGTLLTAIIQSSSVMTSIAIAMVYTRLISLDQGIFLTMGSNIGSCVVAIIAGLTSGMNAKRTALIHLIFNCSGVVIFMIVATFLGVFTHGDITFGTLFEKMFPGAPQTQLAMFHTIFNVITVLIVLPLTSLMVKTVCRLIPDYEPAQDPDAPHLYFIDKNMLKTPVVAVQQTKNEVINMALLANENVNRAFTIISSMDFKEVDKFRKVENELNFLNLEIVDFVVRLSEKKQLDATDHWYLTTVFRTVRDIERIGDYAENIVEYAETLQASQARFSEVALQEISELRVMISKLYEKMMKAYGEEDVEAFNEGDVIEDQIDDYTKQMEENHIERMASGICTPTVGAEYLSLSSNAERIADHWINVGKTILRRQQAK
ncbi:MAG: Na/Pi cotransporter family protein [Bacteroidales bacterium]|nr:Na/Pi cotransporter family protein [Bacteroidales bacterium]